MESLGRHTQNSSLRKNSRRVGRYNAKKDVMKRKMREQLRTERLEQELGRKRRRLQRRQPLGMQRRSPV